jgi:hypothetical protein
MFAVVQIGHRLLLFSPALLRKSSFGRTAMNTRLLIVTARADGTFEVDLRVTLETEDGARYLRTLPRFETAAPKYAFLNRPLAVGSGEIGPEGPVHAIEEIL